MSAGLGGAADPASSFSEPGSPAPGASVSWVAMLTAAIAELYGRPRTSGLSCRDASLGTFRAVQVARGRVLVPGGLARLLPCGPLPPGGRTGDPGELGGG